jgi:quinol monooxygenase YgiN
MINSGLLVRFDVKPGEDEHVEELLKSALPQVAEERGTLAWFGIRFGRSDYGIVDVFPNEATRAVHVAGPVGQSLLSLGGRLLAEPPRVERFDVLAHKWPTVHVDPVTKGLLLTFKAKSGHEREVEAFLRDAEALVKAEPKTIAWFAMHLDDGRYGVFEVFPDNAGRLAHLAGRVSRELAMHALSMLGGVPDLRMLDVICSKLEPLENVVAMAE